MTSFILVALDGLRPDMENATATLNLAALAAWNNVCQCAQRLPIADAGGTPSLITGCRPGAHGMMANTLFDASVAPDRLLRSRLVEDVVALPKGGESPS